MTDEPQDYLALHNATLTRETCQGRTGTRIRLTGNNFFFERQAPEALRRIVNEGIAWALAYFTDNLRRSRRRVKITEHQVEQVAIAVALNHLSTYNLWKNTDQEYRDHDLVLTDDDHERLWTRSVTWHYCQKQFPEDYQSVTAALVGTTRRALAAWEEKARVFWDR